MKPVIVFLLLALFVVPAFPDKPHIINLTKEKYRADNKNWSVEQDERGVMYFGNDAGLLEFDGIAWKLNELPNSQIIRSVAVLSHTTVFTGSYEEFGRWDRDISGELVYNSLSNRLDSTLFKNSDFWKIWITENEVYFQSFNSIFVYDYRTVKPISFDGGFLFLAKVKDEFLVQQMQGALYRLQGESLQKINGSDIFSHTDVRVILPYAKDKYLIGTATHGIYIYDGSAFGEWNPALSAVINAKELNCGILTSRGTYLLGTILDGMYEVDTGGRIVDHISSAHSLQNNTVLSLYEDNRCNVWVALDRGLSYIRYIKNMGCYTYLDGDTRTVYDATIWNGKLFVGTNQGVFYATQDGFANPNFTDMELIDGTQGQVWSLAVVNNRLYCCHNRALKEIQKNLRVSDIYSDTGIYNLTEATIAGRGLLLLSAYASLVIMDKQSGAVYTPKHIPEPIINTAIDHLGNIWLEHANRGVYKCKLADDMQSFVRFSYYGGNSGDGLPYKLKLFKVGGRIVFLGDDRFYTYDDIADKIVPDKILNDCFHRIKNLKRVVAIQKDTFWALTDISIYKFVYDGYQASVMESYDLGMNLSLANVYENISVLNDTISIVCLDNGFLFYRKSNSKDADTQDNPFLPYLEFLQTRNITGDLKYKDLSAITSISYNYNSITFGFSANNVFSSNLSFQYMLKGVDFDWSAPQKVNNVSYARLPEGKYQFVVRTVDNLGNYSEAVSCEFKVLPPWYQSFWAYLLYMAIFAVSIGVIRILVLRQYKTLYLQKIRAHETKRLKTLAKKLQNEVEQKSAELLTLTSFLIQKNELILKIKAIVEEFYVENKSNAQLLLYRKLNVLLNSNLNSETDWKLFLIKFEEKHTGFFKKMRILHPQLTNNDLRLCACLKLNLETKEIASLMNLSVRAVENSRYRLRKKLNILPTQNLNDFFIEIE